MTHVWARLLAGSWTVCRFRRHRRGMKSFALTLNLWIPVLAWLLGSCGGQDASMLVLSRRPFGGDCMDYVTIEIFCRLIPTSK